MIGFSFKSTHPHSFPIIFFFHDFFLDNLIRSYYNELNVDCGENVRERIEKMNNGNGFWRIHGKQHGVGEGFRES